MILEVVTYNTFKWAIGLITLEGFSKLLESAGGLWPIVAMVAFFVLFPSIRRIVKDRNFAVEIAGFKLSAQQVATQTARQLIDLQKRVEELIGHASGDRTGLTFAERASDDSPSFEVELLQGTESSKVAAALKATEASLVLWVDDKPDGNAYEISRLEQAGVDVRLARSTAEGLKIARREKDDVSAIITDVHRREYGIVDKRAGLEFIKQARAIGITCPILVYTGSSRLRPELEAAGASFVTSSPSELFRALNRFAGIKS